MAQDERYNGWRNYETWQAGLWADEYGMRESYPTSDPDVIRSAFEDVLSGPDGDLPGGLMGDILMAWLSDVDWHELAESWSEDES